MDCLFLGVMGVMFLFPHSLLTLQANSEYIKNEYINKDTEDSGTYT